METHFQLFESFLKVNLSIEAPGTRRIPFYGQKVDSILLLKKVFQLSGLIKCTLYNKDFENCFSRCARQSYIYKIYNNLL